MKKITFTLVGTYDFDSTKESKNEVIKRYFAEGIEAKYNGKEQKFYLYKIFTDEN